MAVKRIKATERQRMSQAKQAAILLEGEEVAYQIKESPRRRTLAVYVLPGGLVEVRRPRGLAHHQVEGFLRQRGPWIIRHRERLLDHGPRRLDWAEGALVPFEGVERPLRLAQLNGQQKVMVSPQALWVDPAFKGALGGQPLEARIKRRVEAFWKAEAQAKAEARVAHFAPAIGVAPKSVRAREQKRRWGTANSRGALYFNWRLVLAPSSVMDYVVVHELCHLKEMNHSPRFWALVAGVLPGWQAQRQWLRTQSGHLWFE